MQASLVALGVGFAGLVSATPALAQEEGAAPGTPAVLAPDAHVEFAETPSEGVTPDDTAGRPPEPFAEAPPPRPRRKGLVLESTLGALGFSGRFAHVAPTAFLMRAQVGYEVLDWLMFFGEGELAFTNTSESQDGSQSLAFPIWGIGVGARATLHASPRVAFFFQGEVDGMEADVPHDALTVLGFRNAESFNGTFGGRVGVEWYQIDRHLALSAQGGGRDATGFAKVTANDTALMWDASLGLRYVF